MTPKPRVQPELVMGHAAMHPLAPSPKLLREWLREIRRKERMAKRRRKGQST